ncbi:hypothetical protein [Leifsonia sp. NPDC077715]|uniref:hypothetical protein n=1 Tax=Leifsonia sp. NPDC077715 TaxID=3155539 RepID=UPI003444B443
MNDEPTFDPRRKAAIRDLVVTNAAAHPGRAGGRKRTALVATLVVLALTISGGSVAYALGTGLLDPTPVAAPSPTPTPTVTETATSTPTTTGTAVVAGESEAVEACTLLNQLFMSSGSSEQETREIARSLGAQAAAAADAARSADPRWWDVANRVDTAQASLISYLEDNTPAGVTALETAAMDAREACAPLGVTVTLHE